MTNLRAKGALDYVVAFVDAIVAPTALFSRVGQNQFGVASILMTLFFLSALGALANIPGISVLQQHMASQGIHIPQSFMILSYASLIFYPIEYVLKAILIGYLLWVGLIAVGDLENSLSLTIVTAALVQSVSLIHNVCDCLVLKLTGNYLHPSLAEVGLNQIFTDPRFSSLLSFVNPFTIAYSMVLFFGFRTAARLTNSQCFLALSPYVVLTFIVLIVKGVMMRSAGA